MVSDVVFGNEKMRQKLNALLHPAIKEYILEKIREEREKEKPLWL